MEPTQSYEILYQLEQHQIKAIDPDSDKERFKISDKIISEILVIVNKKYSFSITFENCSFEDDVYIDNVEMESHITFENCSFTKNFYIVSLLAISVKLQNCQVEKSLNIDDCKTTFLDIIKCEAINGINFNSAEIYSLIIEPVNEKTHFTFVGRFLFINELSIKSVSGITIFSKKNIINKITLSGYFNISSRLDFSNIINRDINLDELNNDGKIYFSNIKSLSVKSFKDKNLDEYLDKFITSEKHKYKHKELEFIRKIRNAPSKVIELLNKNYPVFNFKEFIEENHYEDFVEYGEYLRPTFHINNSSLGILEIKNIRFDFYELEIKNSDLSFIKLINSRIPDIKNSDNYLNYYNVYNDLYSSASKQNNTKDKIDYYRISQRYLFLYLKNEAPKRGRDRGSRIAIYISRIFSDHGTNWLQAIGITVLFTFIFFCMFVASLNEVYLDLSKKGIFNFSNIILRFFPQFLNPLHKMDFMDEVSSIGLYSGIVDLLSRITISVGIFEIIRSFRKHVRQ